MNERPYTNSLSIRHRGKAVPYGGVGRIREDGHANYGFRDLKGDQQAHALVPELQTDLVLGRLVRTINEPHTGLFTVGCASGHVDEGPGFRDSGYVEFAINSKAAIASAANYFPIFFHFDRGLHETKFPERFAFDWELEGAQFTDCGDTAGYTCCVYLNSHFHATRALADEAWSEALEFLGAYLQSVPPFGTDRLYGSVDPT